MTHRVGDGPMSYGSKQQVGDSVNDKADQTADKCAVYPDELEVSTDL